LVDKDLGRYAVADGMGGHAAGEVASAQAVKSIRDALAEGKPILEAFTKSPTVESREQIASLMERAIHKACNDIYTIAGGDLGKRGMGTTVVALLAAGRKAVVGHVGDSRVYLYRNGRAHQLTEDHTIIQEQLKRGLITKEQVPTAENKNVITRAVGIQPSVAVDTLVTDVLPGDLFILCSDGLHGYLRSEEHTSELQSRGHLVCRLLLEKKTATHFDLCSSTRFTITRPEFSYAPVARMSELCTPS